MDPYLERRGLWEEVHAGLIVEIQQYLAPLVRPNYRVAIERRTYLALVVPDTFVGKPDVLVVSAPSGITGPKATGMAVASQPIVGELPMPEEVIERYLEVRDAVTGDVLTVIEILSSSNKLAGEGRAQYERKRLKVLGSATNLIEIDLLRAGEPLPLHVEGESNYRIIISRAPHRPRADIYLFGIRDPIPDIPVPLRSGEDEPVLPLNKVLQELYDRVGYDLAIDYNQPPTPPLANEDALWAAQLLQTT
jgi:hypothetical protein